VHDLIAAPFLGEFFLLRPGVVNGVRLPRARYEELVTAPADLPCPPWVTGAAQQAFGLDLAGRMLADAVLVRPLSPLGYSRASYELNLGCNWDCEHCYLGLKQFRGLAWDQRVRLLSVIRDAGVVYLQLTGGEPLIDKLFCETYELACRLGMLLHVSTNGSRLHNPRILELLAACPPYRITVSAYGATEASYDALVRRPGAFRLFSRGMAAALEASLPLRLNIVLTKTNAHEQDAMIAMAERWGLRYLVYSNLSPTIYGGGEVLPAQSVRHLKARKPFTGCNAGHTFFHVDPHGRASICKVGRDEQISLVDEGADGLTRMAEIADSLMLRAGGCSGCALSGTCTVCRPLAKLYQEAKAPLEYYCQHGRRNGS
jgi:MoaA/NifB/PqqE/SkfB family radical SAM enzyme